jgi:hypothetical protein
MTGKPTRQILSSSVCLTVSGTIFIAPGLYFIFLRPPLLPEDPGYMGASFQQIQASLPGLSIWLSSVFWMLAGYMTATGILTCHFALTSFRAKLPGAWWIAPNIRHNFYWNDVCSEFFDLFRFQMAPFPIYMAMARRIGFIWRGKWECAGSFRANENFDSEWQGNGEANENINLDENA